MGLRTDLRTLFARLVASCSDDEKHTQHRPRIIIGSPYDFKHVSGASSVSSSPSDASSSPTSTYSSDTFASSTTSEKSVISEKSTTTFEKSDPIPIPIPTIKRKDVGGGRIPTNTGIEAFLMSRRMGLESGKGDGKSRNVTPGRPVAVAVAVNEDQSREHDAQTPQERDITAPILAGNTLIGDFPVAADVQHAVSDHDSTAVAVIESDVVDDASDEDGRQSEYEEDYEEDENGEDDNDDDEHNGIPLLLEEDESEVVTATAVSMKRFASTDLLSEMRGESE